LHLRGAGDPADCGLRRRILLPATDDALYNTPLTATFLFNQSGQLVKTCDLSVQECEDRYPHLVPREVPRSIFVLAWELVRVRQYYLKAGYNPPERIPVVVRADLDVNLYKRGNLIVALGCDPANGDT
jgi:hypothetical protein